MRPRGFCRVGRGGGRISVWLAGAALGAWLLVPGAALPAPPGASGQASAKSPEITEPEKRSPRLTAPARQPSSQPARLPAAQTAQSRKGMAVTANPHATRAAVEVLRAGGNALDAAIAAQWVLNVVEPQSSGMGGGGFLLLHLPDGRTVALEGRETAPAAAGPDLFVAGGSPQPFYPQRISGGRPVGVPGLPALLAEAHQRYGRTPWPRLTAPAQALARQGFPVSARLAALLAQEQERLGKFPSTRKVFFSPGGVPWKEGEILKQPDLADTLEVIGQQGPEPFYRGKIAQDLVNIVRRTPENPGLLTLEDLAAYHSLEHPTLDSTFGGARVVSFGPPTSGGVAMLEILNLLEAHPPRGKNPYSPENIHRFVQAVRVAYADRDRWLADDAFERVPAKELSGKAYARRRSAALDWDGPLVSVEAGVPPGWSGPLPGLGASLEQPSTTHLSVVDADGMAVSLTSSIEMAFGSGLVVPGRGFLLNNQLTDFSPLPADSQGRPAANRVAGGKRPRSSMTPLLVLKDGKPWLVLGSPGGPRIPQYTAWALVLMLENGWSAPRALAAPHVTHLGGTTFLEPFPPLTPTAQTWLAKKGHRLEMVPQDSGLHAVTRLPKGWWQGTADPRREGLPLGP
ncbi:MAG: gamma-glutamyltransferase [Deltaproteobacteria bacterium]|nr:gamma-glutamyltransferase [Deltaproteobacteria bacterium]